MLVTQRWPKVCQRRSRSTARVPCAGDCHSTPTCTPAPNKLPEPARTRPLFALGAGTNLAVLACDGVGDLASMKPRVPVQEAARGLAGGCASIGGARQRTSSAGASHHHSTPIPEDHKLKEQPKHLLVIGIGTTRGYNRCA